MFIQGNCLTEHLVVLVLHAVACSCMQWAVATATVNKKNGGCHPLWSMHVGVLDWGPTQPSGGYCLGPIVGSVDWSCCALQPSMRTNHIALSLSQSGLCIGANVLETKGGVSQMNLLVQWIGMFQDRCQCFPSLVDLAPYTHIYTAFRTACKLFMIIKIN
jgi:hypothetical protein